MKKVSVICFFSLLCIFVLGFIIGKWNYPNKRPAPIDNQDANIGLNLAVDSAQSTTTCDTIYVIEHYDETTGIKSLHYEKIPSKFIDHTREEISSFLTEYEENPSLEDKKNGLDSVTLLSFSPEKIIISKAYQTLSKNTGFYLLAMNGKICVYYEDKKRIYYETELTLDDFPEAVRLELLRGKYIETEAEVYAFLESFTS